tara:strand:- start:1037 stop:1183 length:147 start_codon:yes stop_codon:yes gene_type:complete
MLIKYEVRCAVCDVLMDTMMVEERHVKRWEKEGDDGAGSCVNCGKGDY